AFVRNFDQAMKEAPALMKTIFEDALPHMKAFRNAVDRASYRPPGAVNTSGTGVAISRMAQDSFGKLATAMGLSGDATLFALLKGASVLSKNVGRNYAKELKPGLPSNAFAA